MLLEIFTSLFVLPYKILSSVGPFILLLGVLVFIHELGHFLAARYCNVKVEVFSLGFGPKIFKYRKGETLYAISLFPLGGYVKMFGDNPAEEVPLSQQPRGFLYKNVPQKLLIAFGGPLMNLIFTLFAFFLLGFIGVPSLKPKMGDIKKNTLAYVSGLRSGDTILSINEKPISYWEDVDRFIKKNPNRKISLEVSNKNNKIKKHTVNVGLKNNENIFTTKKTIGFIEGLTPLSRASQVGIVFNSPSYKSGLRTFDKITNINGEEVRYWRDLKRIVRKEQSNLFVTIKRQDKDLQMNLKGLGSLKNLGIENAFLYISKIGKGTPADKAGLKKGDRLFSIDGKEIKNWREVLETIQSFSGKKFLVEFFREGKKQQVSIAPKTMYVEGHLKEKFMLGIASGGVEALPPEILKQETLLGSVVYSGVQTWHWLSVISIGLYRLIQGRVSARTLGGPVTIGRVAHSSFQNGFISFIFIMALISLNLFFLNLLPIPMLDGGHILFFTIEGILGRPLDIKKLMVAQQMGVFVLIFFFAFTFFNDIYNWLNAW